MTRSRSRREPEFDWEDPRPFAGASGPGLPSAPAYRPDQLLAGRSGPDMTGPLTDYEILPPSAAPDAGPATAPLTAIRVRGPQPATFPALPDDTGPMRRMPKLRALQQRERPVRPADAFIPVWSPVLGQFIMVCGTCPPERRSRYADPIAGHMPHEFEALRVSAYVSGWRLDAFARWACPACQMTDRYRAPYGVILWDPGAAGAYLRGLPQDEQENRQAAEHDLIRAVADAAGTGRHRARAS